MIAIPALIYFIGPAPRWLFQGLVCLSALIGITEFFRAFAPQITPPHKVAACLLSGVTFGCLFLRRMDLLPAVIALWASVPLALALFARETPTPQLSHGLGQQVLAQVYITLPLVLILTVRDIPEQGAEWVFFLLIVVFGTDTGAYLAGKLFGRHKLARRISPNKTWEGAVGGLLLGGLGGLYYARLTSLHPLSWALAGLVVTLSVCGQVGDLGESLLKRSHGCKDSGQLLPGHGGLLDRIDALIFAAPLLFLYLRQLPTP